MKYQLIKGVQKGVIVDPTPVLKDVKDTFKVSFILPCVGAYIALFKGEDGIEYKAALRNGEVIFPKALLAKEQTVEVCVCMIDSDKIVDAWQCQPLKVGAFLQMRQTMRQLSPGVTLDAVYQRIAELENDHAAISKDFDDLKQKYVALLQQNNMVIKELTDHIAGYTHINEQLSLKNDEYANKLALFEAELQDIKTQVLRIFEALEQ